MHVTLKLVLENIIFKVLLCNDLLIHCISLINVHSALHASSSFFASNAWKVTFHCNWAAKPTSSFKTNPTEVRILPRFVNLILEYACLYMGMYFGMYLFLCVFLYDIVCISVCMYVCTGIQYVCLYVTMCVYTCLSMYICIIVCFSSFFVMIWHFCRCQKWR